MCRRRWRAGAASAHGVRTRSGDRCGAGPIPLSRGGPKPMNFTRRIVPWLGRFVLLAAIVIFTLIGIRYLADPVGAAGAFRTSFGSAAGVTSFRVGFGAFPLAI